MFEVRHATLQDARVLFEWRNDAVTRQFSCRHEEISWDDHVRWLSTAIAATDRHLYLMSNLLGEPLGTSRFDLLKNTPTTYEVSFTVAPPQRGKRLGRLLLGAAESAFVEDVPSAQALLAIIHEDNVASVMLFVNHGYVLTGSRKDNGFVGYEKPLPSERGSDQF